MENYKPPESFKNGRYLAQGLLGTGTYGHVLLCRDQFLGADVAVKVAQSNAAYRQSALNEICALKKILDNTYCVQLLDAFEDAGHICIVTELLDRNLLQLLRGRGFSPLEVSDLKKVCRSILQALTALHRAGLMHCDVKPENVMLRRPSSSDNCRNNALQHVNRKTLKDPLRTNIQCKGIGCDNTHYHPHIQRNFTRFNMNHSPDFDESDIDFDRTCLIDFGAVRRVDDNSYYDIQSLWYRAPEILCGLPYTAKIDSWGVGCLLAELYTGKALFPGENTQDQISRIARFTAYPLHTTSNLAQNVKQFQLLDPGCNRQQAALQMSSWLKSCRQSSLHLRCKEYVFGCFPQTKQGLKVNNNGTFPWEGSILQSSTNAHSNLSLLTPKEEGLLIDLILRLLSPDDRYRLSCEEALRHPFLGTPPPTVCNTFSSSNLSRPQLTVNDLYGDANFQTSLQKAQLSSPSLTFASNDSLSSPIMYRMSSVDAKFHAPPVQMRRAVLPQRRVALTHTQVNQYSKNHNIQKLRMPETCIMAPGADLLTSDSYTAAGDRDSSFFCYPPFNRSNISSSLPNVSDSAAGWYHLYHITPDQTFQETQQRPTLYTPIYSRCRISF